MADTKEPGQTAYEAWQAYTGFWSGWERRPADDKAQWAAVEAAVMEKAARIAENFNKSGACIGIAAAIRAAKEG